MTGIFKVVGILFFPLRCPGPTVLTLAFDDAQTQGGTLTWMMTDQPWEDGDLLMLRIEEVVPEVSLSNAGAPTPEPPPPTPPVPFARARCGTQGRGG